MTTIPFDWIVLASLGLQQSNSVEARYVALLRLLRMGRAYRLRRWMQFLSNNQWVAPGVLWRQAREGSERCSTPLLAFCCLVGSCGDASLPRPHGASDAALALPCLLLLHGSLRLPAPAPPPPPPPPPARAGRST
jgi:hypothetical protein